MCLFHFVSFSPSPGQINVGQKTRASRLLHKWTCSSSVLIVFKTSSGVRYHFEFLGVKIFETKYFFSAAGGKGIDSGMGSYEQVSIQFQIYF